MAEPISLASGLLTLAVFAFQGSRSLYITVESFQTSRRAIRDLKEELEALNETLQSLQETIADDGAELEGLKLPLLRCGKACRDFEEIINKCVKHSGTERTSFRDWAKFMYMGEDIARFKATLGGYKDTICIAIGGATFRKATVTEGVVKEYKDMITNATADLQEHLEQIDDKLWTLSQTGEKISGQDETEWLKIKEEKDSTEKCLQICAQVSEHINRVQPNNIADISSISDTYQTTTVTDDSQPTSAKRVIDVALKECKERLATTSSELNERVQNLNDRLAVFLSSGVRLSDDDRTELKQIQEEKDSLQQCLAICTEASAKTNDVRMNVFEDITSADDTQQLIVSTIGDLISAKHITTGSRSSQWMGQMSDETIQQVSRDRSLVEETLAEPQSGLSFGEFDNRYGAGIQLGARKATERPGPSHTRRKNPQHSASAHGSDYTASEQHGTRMG